MFLSPAEGASLGGMTDDAAPLRSSNAPSPEAINRASMVMLEGAYRLGILSPQSPHTSPTTDRADVIEREPKSL